MTERTAVQYDVYKNSLTTPPSFYAKVNPRAIFGLATICQEINILQPSIPIEIIDAVLTTFQQVVKEEVAAGNRCKIENFVSFRPKLSGSMPTSDSPLPADAFSVEVVPSTTMQIEVANMASFERLSVKVKAPSIASVFDSNTGIQNLVREGYGFVINGAQMAWDQSDAELGVFLTSSNATVRQTNIGYNKATKAIIIPTLDAGISSPNVEYELSVKNRYTENGQVRTGTYTTKCRTTNVISDGTTDQVFAIGAAAGPATLDYVGAQVDCQIEISIDPSSNTLKMRIGDISGVFGPNVEASTTGAYVLTGLASDVTININDYDVLYANVLSYGRYMKEVCDLSPLTP